VKDAVRQLASAVDGGDELAARKILCELATESNR